MLLACVRTEQKKLRHSHLWAAYCITFQPLAVSMSWLPFTAPISGEWSI